jgi:hypothetical protein
MLFGINAAMEVSMMSRGTSSLVSDGAWINIERLTFELAALMSATVVAAALLFVGMTLEHHSHRPLLGAKSMSYTSTPAAPSVDAPIHYI